MVYEEGGALTKFIKDNPTSVILFDEIEKADPAIYDRILLQLLDAGRLTGSYDGTVDATGCIIIMTSNLGSNKMGDHGMEITGFGTVMNSQSELDKQVMTAVEHKFRVEQINRFDAVVVFHPLDMTSLEKVFLMKWNPYLKRLDAQGHHVIMSDQVPKWFATKSRKDKYGARNLIRTMNNVLVNPMADGIIDKTLTETINIDVVDNDISITAR